MPRFHAGKGIVRKCDMCSDRLAAGEAPACIQACPHEAIVIRIVDKEVIARAEAGVSCRVCRIPDPPYQQPFTGRATCGDPGTWAGGRPPARARARSLAAGRHARADATGGRAASWSNWPPSQAGRPTASARSFTPPLPRHGMGGTGASVLHLGRPLYAYRAIIGLRHSWLSREVLAFGFFAAARDCLRGAGRALSGLGARFGGVTGGFARARCRVGSGGPC